jgi:hypothetical protein|tara:strand:- start:509 stop:1135 length:627 start_codon:yes stop_codon:yes gene_type:complete
MHKNTCWFFGDSFTRGNGCHPNHEYYKSSYTHGCERWTTTISKTLDMTEVNTAMGGESNLGILNSLISNIKNIKKGDCVILGDTRPVRVSSFDDSGTRINIINDPHFNYTQGNSKYIFDYIYHEIVPKEDMYLEFYQKMFKELLDELKRRGVHTYYWKHTDIWFPTNMFNTITEDTNGVIQNLHWSWKGHTQMTEFILTNIENSNPLI